ncbi:MAG: hypothetical protein OXN89_10685 [Bryobacterales bacterium]|nr:hypothetical protein [Bryobacterales bacterium]
MAGRRIGAAMLAMLCAAPYTAEGQAERPDTRSRDEASRFVPSPAELAIWTERPGYLRFHDLIRVYLTADPNGDRRDFSEFLFLEDIQTGNRRYLGGTASSRWLRDEIVDSTGMRSWQWVSARVAPRSASRIWTGRIVDPGLWQFVVELRSPDTTEVIKRAHAKFVVSARIPKPVGTPGANTEIATDTTWTNQVIHSLRGRVFVNAGATLTVEPGTLVLAKGPEAAIVVEQGGRIVAAGRPEAPIVMTCDDALGERSAGCWGGLVILGRAPATPGTDALESLVPTTRSVFGGEDPFDASGILRYLRVEFAAAGSATGTEMGGIGFYGVGSGTIVSHVQSHASAGDGIRFVGGTVNCRYCVSSGAADDGLDWSQGWQGSAQFLFLVQDPSVGDCAIEGRGPYQGLGVVPLGLPKLYNVTAVGSAAATSGTSDAQDCGILLHRGGAAMFRNVILTGFPGGPMVMRGSSAMFFRNRISSVTHAIMHANGGLAGGSRATNGTEHHVVYSDADPKLVSVRYRANLEPRPMLESPAKMMGAGVTPPSDGFLDTRAQWIGAFNDSNWLEEWTFFGPESEYCPESTRNTEIGGCD